MHPLDIVPLRLGRHGPEDTLMSDLLDGLEQMVRRHHIPSAWLLVRLTDGRVRMVACPAGGTQAREQAGRIRNEYGPFSVAFSVQAEAVAGAVRLVVENLCRQGPARMERFCESPRGGVLPPAADWPAVTHSDR